MSVFEVLMLVCIGFAWPTAIYKSIKSKSVEGKSILFLYIIMAGYLFGMIHKIVYNLDFVIVLYAINFLMVFTDMILYHKHKKIYSEEGVSL